MSYIFDKECVDDHHTYDLLLDSLTESQEKYCLENLPNLEIIPH
ncbi:hypothetical protein NVP1121O_176 [Vibrio phage 1.121.O._10N.286.46.C4]|nr:hypothetical protein NVP1121O_176 [Vibrio phage 1.121.O._10N.286.46.C4]